MRRPQRLFAFLLKVTPAFLPVGLAFRGSARRQRWSRLLLQRELWAACVRQGAQLFFLDVAPQAACRISSLEGTLTLKDHKALPNTTIFALEAMRRCCSRRRLSKMNLVRA